MAAKEKLKALSLDPKMTVADATNLLGRIGGGQRAIAHREAALDEKVTALRQKAAAGIAPLEASLAANEAVLRLFAEAYRKELCPPGKKTAVLATGELTWRTSPPAVTLTGVAKVIERLKAAALYKFIRVKESVNKDAVLDDPAAVKAITGIAVKRVETLEIKAYETPRPTAKPAKPETGQ